MDLSYTPHLYTQTFHMSPLPSVLGHNAVKHLGIVNLFLIKESTSIREVQQPNCTKKNLLSLFFLLSLCFA